MQAALPQPALSRWRDDLSPNGEWVLLLALLGEAALFSVIARNFLTPGNFFEILRSTSELGLLALAMTPVIVSGGIDLSVGSMMGLAAVLFGAASKDWHLSLGQAAMIALVAGCAGGALNGLLIARFRLPPLVVTLATYSLFRGIAEGLTHGAVNYTGFPQSFLFLGQGYLWGAIPVQLTALVLVFLGYWVLLHKSIIGRALYAIGLAPAGARYAGIPVGRRVGAVYLLCGTVSSVAALLYVAHLGQARADAGSGYELDAITAVVLGGASIFGGRGTLWGTLLGLGCLSVLQNGLHLAALPSELTGILTGTLLVLVIGFERLGSVWQRRAGVFCGALLAGSLLVAEANHWIASPNAGRRLTIAVMPKAKGDPYFVSARAGAEQAAKELGVDLIWDGPTSLDAARQNELVENWITRGVDAIAVAVENKTAISTVLRKARQKGIRVITWDADAEPDARDFFANQATPEGIANTLTDEAARLLNGRGEFAIITGALTAANQNEWIAFIKKRLAKYPGLKLATIRPSDDDRDKAFAETQTVLEVYPRVQLIMAISAPAVPGAGEAVRQSQRKDVDVIGLSLPSISKSYVHAGLVQTVVLWNVRDLGYLSVYASALVAEGKVARSATSLQVGRLRSLRVQGSEIILGTPLIINRKNIDQLDF
ncbi:MAG TPA: substrate-binding domain-containing protein [Bryobacteraceae bacterium]|jgi:rhamnose transport system permease protein